MSFLGPNPMNSQTRGESMGAANGSQSEARARRELDAKAGRYAYVDGPDGDAVRRPGLIRRALRRVRRTGGPSS